MAFLSKKKMALLFWLKKMMVLLKTYFQGDVIEERIDEKQLQWAVSIN